MVIGIEKFREFFSGHEDKYAIIGGAACDLLFDAAGLPFRATKDIDMVLCVEVVDRSFGKQIAAFLDAGGYKARERSEGQKQFYRFHRPSDKAFPYMLELFSRRPEALHLPDEAVISRIPVEEGIVSLSAVLLEEEYFRALQSSRRIIDGVAVLDEKLLIPFKVRAFLDLKERRAGGSSIDEKHVKKHRNDVFRLLQLLPYDAAIEVPEAIQTDLRRFIEQIKADEAFNPASFDVQMTLQEGIDLLGSAYGI